MQRLTQLIHNGTTQDPQTGASSPPIFQSSTFAQPSEGDRREFTYSRTANPTRKLLEDLMAELEHGTAGFAFASGMAAISTCLLLLKPGDHIIVSEDVYGGTYGILDSLQENGYLHVSYVPTMDVCRVEAAFTDKTRAVYLETPSNPTLQVSDIRVISQL
ncbi:MAG: aminotransferase class I/II-fold pyridoxal phosphate-dependent enzyme, partial [Firmicutes bacterium]|nr:aminotransferase class I/II-fold pyridoxal phosphate-dependent enzyme [Bacillota bacterium]